MVEDRKRNNAGYDDMDADDQEDYDSRAAASNGEREERDDEEKEMVDYDSMDHKEKAIYDQGLFKYKMDKYQACSQDEGSLLCEKAGEIRTEQEETRMENGYYHEETTNKERAQMDREQAERVGELLQEWENEPTEQPKDVCMAICHLHKVKYFKGDKKKMAKCVAGC